MRPLSGFVESLGHHRLGGAGHARRPDRALALGRRGRYSAWGRGL